MKINTNNNNNLILFLNYNKLINNLHKKNIGFNK